MSRGGCVFREALITPGPGEIVGGRTLSFEICIDPTNQNVTRYELRAWGL